MRKSWLRNFDWEDWRTKYQDIFVKVRFENCEDSTDYIESCEIQEVGINITLDKYDIYPIIVTKELAEQIIEISSYGSELAFYIFKKRWIETSEIFRDLII